MTGLMSGPTTGPMTGSGETEGAGTRRLSGGRGGKTGFPAAPSCSRNRVPRPRGRWSAPDVPGEIARGRNVSRRNES